MASALVSEQAKEASASTLSAQDCSGVRDCFGLKATATDTSCVMRVCAVAMTYMLQACRQHQQFQGISGSHMGHAGYLATVS